MHARQYREVVVGRDHVHNSIFLTGESIERKESWYRVMHVRSNRVCYIILGDELRRFRDMRLF